MIQIPIAALKKARTLLGRVRSAQCKLPVLNHILARIDSTGITLAVSDLDHWLETRIPLPVSPNGPTEFLIPNEALTAAVKADNSSSVILHPKGRNGHRELKLVAISGGMRVESNHATADWEDFPARPVIDGTSTLLPAATMAALKTVAPCASTDDKRQVLQGVFFDPEDGGMLVATDGRKLAGAPATVPESKFILPSPAVKVLGHSDFLKGDVTVTLPDDTEKNLAAFRAGDHVLMSKTIVGNYPNYQQVIPSKQDHSVTIADDRRDAVCKWLRSQKGRAESVRLSIDKPGQLTLTQTDRSGSTIAIITVPVEIQGVPPVISFDPKNMADALVIGGTLGISDAMNPGMTRTPGGRFCVVMPLRTKVAAQAAA
jgi:DNA polymerase-3 subunit beta